jgi:hypothetical protein
MRHSSGCGWLVGAQLELRRLEAHLVDVGAGVGLGRLGARHVGLVLLDAGATSTITLSPSTLPSRTRPPVAGAGSNKPSALASAIL